MRYLPSEFVGYNAAPKAADHAADGEDRHCDRVQTFDGLVGQILLVPRLVHVLHEVLDVGLRRVYHARVVAELQHAQHRREDRVRQEERQPLKNHQFNIHYTQLNRK